MKTILLLTILLMAIPQNQAPAISNEELPVSVVGFKWFKDRQ